MSFRIMLAGGGTGGHVYPLIAVAEEIKRLAPEYHKHVKICFIGDGDLLAESARELGMSHRRVTAPKWRRNEAAKNFLDVLKVPVALLQSVIYVWSFMPDVMLVKGGYGSFFPALAARIMFIPLVVHESDSVPGKTNLFWGRHARRVFVAFEHALKYFKVKRAELVGNPIRSALEHLPDHAKAVADFGFPANKPVVLVTGGSQGAEAINEVVGLAIAEMSKTFSVLHQCGVARAGVIMPKQEIPNYKIFETFSSEQIAQAYAAADVIVSRAGSAIFEIATVGKPAILIPLDGSAQNHQLVNAEEFSGHGGIVIPQDNLTPHILMNQIAHAYEQREKLSALIRAFAKPHAASIIAKELLGASTL